MGRFSGRRSTRIWLVAALILLLRPSLVRPNDEKEEASGNFFLGDFWTQLFAGFCLVEAERCGVLGLGKSMSRNKGRTSSTERSSRASRFAPIFRRCILGMVSYVAPARWMLHLHANRRPTPDPGAQCRAPIPAPPILGFPSSSNSTPWGTQSTTTVRPAIPSKVLNTHACATRSCPASRNRIHPLMEGWQILPCT